MSAILKAETEIQQYNFTCSFVWVRNLVTDPKGSTDLLGESEKKDIEQKSWT
jgi:hypothetical protein